MSQVITIEEAMGSQVEVKKKRDLTFSEEQKFIIKNVIAKGLSEDEFKMFLYICMRHSLDPIARQIYAVKRGGQMTIQTGIDGLRLIAERTGKYAPGKATEFQYGENKKLVSATAFVKKKVDNEWHEISATAFMSEYLVNNTMWQKMPHVMLEKCAEARAIRRAFPSDTSGIYTEDEMQQATNVKEEVEEKISKEKCEAIERYLEDKEELKEKVLKFCNIKKIEDMTEKQSSAVKLYLDKEGDKQNEDN